MEPMFTVYEEQTRLVRVRVLPRLDRSPPSASSPAPRLYSSPGGPELSPLSASADLSPGSTAAGPPSVCPLPDTIGLLSSGDTAVYS